MSGLIGGNIVTNGLVMYLDAGNRKSYNGSGTTWYDLSGRGNNATLQNSPTHFPNNKGGFDLNGINQYASMSMVNPYSETIIAWVKSGQSTWNNPGWISSSRRQNGHIIHVQGGGHTHVTMYFLNSSSTYYNVGAVYPSNITIPNMYCITTNGSNSHKVYLNGEFITESTTSITRTTSPTAQNYEIGKDDTWARYGDGVIYNVMRYNRQLSDTEVLQNYNAMKGRYL